MMELIVPELRKLRDSLIKKRERLKTKLEDKPLDEKLKLLTKFEKLIKEKPNTIEGLEKQLEEIEELRLQEKKLNKQLEYLFSASYNKDWQAHCELDQKILQLNKILSLIADRSLRGWFW